MPHRTLLLVALTSIPAFAGELFVNGVSVDGITNQTFEKVNVKIDDKGNIYIDAPGYSVKRVGGSDVPPVSPSSTRDLPSITKHYFLVTEQNPPGMTEYDIDVFINGKFIRSMHSTDDQIVSDVTRHLKPGRNLVSIQAKKNYANKDAPKSVSKAHVFRVIIGEGVMGPDQVVIETPLITFSRTAADLNDLAQEYPLTAR